RHRNISMDIIAFPVASFVVGQITLAIEAAKYNLTGDIVHAIPLRHHAEVFPVETQGKVIGVLWNGRVGIGNVIACVDDSIAVIVDNMKISGKLLIIVVVVYSARIKFVPGVVIARAYVRIGLTDLFMIKFLIMWE